MTLPRAALLTVVLASLGVATSVGVAWGVSLIPHGSPTTNGPPGLHRIIGHCRSEFFVVRFEQDHRWQKTQTTWNLYPIADFSPDWDDEMKVIESGERLLRDESLVLPLWIQEIDSSKVPLPSLRQLLWALQHPHRRSGVFETWQGWPWRCLYSESLASGDDNGPAFMQESGALIVNHSEGLFFAYLPLFPGILLNTAFYASIYFAIGFGFVSLRRARRRRRGQCPRCAYDLRASTSPVCPECGHAHRLSPSLTAPCARSDSPACETGEREPHSHS